MELRQLSAFIAVADELHFGRAAENLHIAQPALSQLIRALEKELGVRSFERTTRRVRMTSSGEALLEPARSIENQVAGAKTTGPGGPGGSSRPVHGRIRRHKRIFHPVLLAHEVAEKHPGISLELHPQTYSGEAALAVRDGEMDLAVISPPSPAGVDVHVIRQETSWSRSPPAMPSPSARRCRCATADQPFISYAPSHGSARSGR